MSDGLPSGDDVARLSDKLNVVGIDATDYNKDVYQYNGTFKVELLQQGLDLLDSLGWEEVTCGSIVPPNDDDGGRLLLLTPDTEEPWTSEQASIGIAGRIKPDFEPEQQTGGEASDVKDGRQALTELVSMCEIEPTEDDEDADYRVIPDSKLLGSRNVTDIADSDRFKIRYWVWGKHTDYDQPVLLVEDVEPSDE